MPWPQRRPRAAATAASRARRSWTSIVAAVVAAAVAGALPQSGAAECVNDILYDYVSISALATNITDAKLRPEFCPAKPMYGTVPARALTGAPLVADPEAFDRDSTSLERISYIQQEVETPYMVDVDKLTDEEIMSSCLTVADCRMPPALSIVRRVRDDKIWQPSVSKTSSKFKDMFGFWCCDVNEPMAGFAYEHRNSNRRTIVRSFPAMKGQFRHSAKFQSLKFYPRTATSAAEAKIVRINFAVGSTNLYMYVDNTCNDLKGERWLNGFMGNSARSGSGLFHEVIFKSSNSRLPNAHNPASQDRGPIPLDTNSFTIQYLGNFRADGKAFQWAAVKNLWYYAPIQGANTVGYQRMASIHIKTAMEWLLLAPPKGNLPVALLYTFASKMYLDAASSASSRYDRDKFDFSLIEAHQGHHFEHYLPALEYLLEPNEDTGRARIFHALTVLDDFEECRDSMLAKFYDQFSNPTPSKRKPPEAGCIGAADPVMNCQLWHSRRCRNTFDVLYAARATMWKSFHESIPQCTSCPGLIGWWRSGVTMNPNVKLQAIARYPQCLPWRDSDGTLQDTLGYDMYTTDVYELDYDEGFTCDTSTCRFTDVLDVPLDQLVEAVQGQACADASPFKTGTKSTLDLCREACHSIGNLACVTFAYNPTTNLCKLYKSCSVLTTRGATADDVIYMAKPKVSDHSRSWLEPAEFTLLGDTPAPTNSPTSYPTSSPTRFPTKGPTNGPTNFPTMTPTKSPTQAPTEPTPRPTDSPTQAPTEPTARPTSSPTGFPTGFPTTSPTSFPTPTPTTVPTSFPTGVPTELPVALHASDIPPITCATQTARYMGGSRIGTYRLVKTLQGCIDRCMARDNCAGYTWQSSDKVCWLFDGNYRLKTRSYYSRYTSGPRVCPLDSGCEQQFVEIRGRNAAKFENIETAEDCAKVCNGRSKCLAWFYLKHRRRCILRSSVTGQRAKYAYFTSGLQSACAAYGTLAST